jgi:periplasmic protein CpxP/Spy
MLTRKAALPALALAAALAVAGTGAPQAYAQASTAAPQAQAQPPERHHVDPTRHIEGRIAYLKAELKITPAQERQFDRVAQAMRDNAKDMAQAFEQHRADRDKSQSAVDQLEARHRMAEMHAQHVERFLAAFRPLYDSFSDQQKHAADDLLGEHHHFHHRH